MEAGDTVVGRDRAVRCGQVALDDLGLGGKGRSGRVPGEGADRVAAGQEFADDLTADGSGGTGGTGGTGGKDALRLCQDTTTGRLAVNSCPQEASSGLRALSGTGRARGDADHSPQISI